MIDIWLLCTQASQVVAEGNGFENEIRFDELKVEQDASIGQRHKFFTWIQLNRSIYLPNQCIPNPFLNQILMLHWPKQSIQHAVVIWTIITWNKKSLEDRKQFFLSEILLRYIIDSVEQIGTDYHVANSPQWRHLLWDFY